MITYHPFDCACRACRTERVHPLYRLTAVALVVPAVLLGLLLVASVLAYRAMR